MNARDRPLADLLALRGQQVEVETVDVTEDVDGVPSWIKVDREMATVVIIDSLLSPRRREIPAEVHTGGEE